MFSGHHGCSFVIRKFESRKILNDVKSCEHSIKTMKEYERQMIHQSHITFKVGNQVVYLLRAQMMIIFFILMTFSLLIQRG